VTSGEGGVARCEAASPETGGVFAEYVEDFSLRTMQMVADRSPQ
jgi:hypothetical protein